MVLKVGFHVSRHGRELSAAIAEDLTHVHDKTGTHADIVQIFVHGPQSYKRIAGDYDRLAKRAGCNVVVHGSYMDHPWSASRPAVACIVDEFKICAAMGGVGVIVHMSKALAEDPVSGAQLLNQKIQPCDATLFLEVNAAKPGPHTFDTAAKINAIAARVAAVLTVVRVGVCIDTAHLHSLGVKDIVGVIRGVTVRPVIVHLNDSAVALGAGRDVHAPLRKGKIWKKDDAQLIEIIRYCNQQAIPIILERDFKYVPADIAVINTALKE